MSLLVCKMEKSLGKQPQLIGGRLSNIAALIEDGGRSLFMAFANEGWKMYGYRLAPSLMATKVNIRRRSHPNEKPFSLFSAQFGRFHDEFFFLCQPRQQLLMRKKCTEISIYFHHCNSENRLGREWQVWARDQSASIWEILRSEQRRSSFVELLAN